MGCFERRTAPVLKMNIPVDEIQITIQINKRKGREVSFPALSVEEQSPTD